MASVEASAVLGADVTLNPGASVTPFIALPFPPSTTGPAHQPLWEQHVPPPMTPSFPSGQPLVLLALPRTPLVSEDAAHGSIGTGACNIVVQVRSEAGQPLPSQTQTIVLTQAPLNRSDPGAPCGGTVCPAPLFLQASAVETIVPASALGGTQPHERGWFPGLSTQAPQPATQLAPIIPPVNPGPQPHGVSSKGNLATTQSKASPDDSCNPNSVYKNFRRWQSFKALARRHLPQSPDTEALSCFLIPVLRSLSRLKPTMTLEEGMWRAMQEWQHKSNYDRMIYYEMAEKFMEFEAEDEMQIQKLQLMKGAQGPPPPAPPRPDPQGSPAPVVDPQAAPAPRKTIPRDQQAHRHQRPLQTETPNEIPPEAVKEYMDIMDELLGPAHSATGQPGGECEEDGKEFQEEEDDNYPDLGLLSYINELCSQEDFVTKVEGVIHPQFMEQLISPEVKLDLLGLTEELEQEEGLTPAQLVEKRLRALKGKEGVQLPSSHHEPLLDSGPSESVVDQDAQRCDHSPQLGVSDRTCPSETDFKDYQRHGQVDAHLSRPKAFAVSSGRQEYPPLQAPPSPSQGHGRTYSDLGPRDASIPREASPVRDIHRPVDRSRENEEDLPSLAFLWASPESLLPSGLSLSPVPASGLACPGGWGPQGSAQSQFFQTLGLSRVAPTASKSGNALGGGPARAEKTLIPGSNLSVSGKPVLALEMVCSSQPQKRKCDQSITERSSKRHYSE
ncbi:NUT family member 2G-like [Phyllostomus hastatus]|uniref:NUT family member 2G-like n=1 Tax=Phyllostomus hastatus TaxID=9423 RepID=UPI001E67E7AC|nr:NUT family member 2G-like [Phyllostomus hastatus]